MGVRKSLTLFLLPALLFAAIVVVRRRPVDAEHEEFTAYNSTTTEAPTLTTLKRVVEASGNSASIYVRSAPHESKLRQVLRTTWIPDAR